MDMTAVGLAAAVRGGAVSARTATEWALDRIAERDGRLRAFRVVRAEEALAEAALIDDHPGRGSMPLAGVPIAVKDNVAVTGMTTGNGSAGSDRRPQPADHEVVARLRAAGAVVVGLTNVPELCVFGATDSRTAGITRNPWDPDRTPGGSSGGSAAAVAAGMVPLAHGNDGMGSIRIPAACTGLVGIKPGLGLVPAGLGNGSWFAMTENGALATNAVDAALMLSVLAGRPELAEVEVEGRAPLRVGVSVKAPVLGLRVDPEYVRATRQIADLLAGAGHRVRAREVPYSLRAGPAAMVRWFAGAELEARSLADRSKLEPRVARHARLGTAVLAAGGPWPEGRTAWVEVVRRHFEDVDVVLTPMLAQLPLRAVAWSERGWAANVLADVRYAPFAAPWNLAGWPAVAVPAGVHRGAGLPLSVQLVGRPGSEPVLLRLAAEIEQLRPWPRIAPGYGAR